jgi:hypothetical protein
MENKNFSVPRKQRTKFILFHFHAKQSLLNNKTHMIAHTFAFATLPRPLLLLVVHSPPMIRATLFVSSHTFAAI